MLYFLSTFRDAFSGLNIFRYITFRAGAAAFTSFLLCIIIGPLVIRKLKNDKIREDAGREHCDKLSEIQKHKQGTPTMGGIFIIGSILISVLLWSDLSSPYVLITILTCIWLAILGFVDDHLKVVQGNQKGLHARTKLIWQSLLGCLVGYFIFWHPEISTKLDIPFFKLSVLNLGIFYIPFAILIIVGSSNAVNLTDGLDGLAIGCVLIVAMGLGSLSYISGHFKFAEYLFLPYIQGGGELSVFCAAILGASLGFLWFNCYPASIFMGDTGSLALGGTLGIIAILIKKELLLVILGGIFVMEALSVILQVGSVKLRKKRMFKIAPFHHHLQFLGWSESKIIIRFWIIAVILALLTLTTLKIR
ncbi:MAG: phospho-N-acetylmuramoyl-pentapeptide-transferase [Candidatus Aceula lacicola]|nr:phospho-N-acetylmuramoyl-pentapeptide-transferase [Candidatus Aceula lacicola]